MNVGVVFAKDCLVGEGGRVMSSGARSGVVGERAMLRWVFGGVEPCGDCAGL